MRIVIVEDEPAIARNLQFLLVQSEPGIQVTVVLASVADSIEWFTNNSGSYDLIFMDIRLNDGLSFKIFDQIIPDAPVVFVTAYNDYALQAFKANGIDYILKPFTEKDLASAISKFKRFTSHGMGGDQLKNLYQIAEKLKTLPASYKQSFLVHFREKLIPLTVEEISWFYTTKETVYLHAGDNRQFIVDFSMEYLQQSLDPQLFFRANRQFIINRKAIREVEFYFNGRLSVQTFLDPEERIIISKARVPEFKTWMNV